MIQSSAYVVVPGIDYQYHFCGVISIQHTYTSQVASGADSAIGTDYLNGVRNLPSQVTLTVAETDTMRQSGWSARMLEAFEAIKLGRHLCTLVTSMKTYTNMVLTDFDVIQDEASHDGWSGTLTFTQTNIFGWGKAVDNSTIVNTASTGPVQTVSNSTGGTTVISSGSGRASSAQVLSPLQQMAQRAGVRL